MKSPGSRLLPAAVLVVATLLAYAPVTGAGFVWDDDAHISHNDTLLSAKGLHDIWLVPGATMQYYPLTFTAWWVGYRLWGLAPLGYHLTTLLFHIVASLLLWTVLARLVPSTTAAWLGAMVFALHPVNVMSVAWATELKNTLSSSLALGSCWAYLRFAGVGESEIGDRRLRARLYGLSLGLFLLAMLAKTAVGMLPATLLLILWWKKDRLRAADLLPLVPMIVIAAGMAFVTVYVEHHSGGAVGREFTIGFADRVLVSGRSFWFYLGKLVFPYPLAFIYERWDLDPRSALQWLFPVATGAALAALFFFRDRIGKGAFVAALHDYVATSGLIFLVVTYMTRYAFVSDHWQYYGAMSVAALIGVGLARFVAAGAAGRAAAVVILLALAALTWRQTRLYRDVETLFQATLETSPRAWMCLTNLGVLRNAQGRPQEAIALFDRALAINADNEETLNDRGSAYLQLGDSRHAIDDCTRAIALWPELTQAYATRAMAHANLGELELAVADLTRAIELRPTFAEAYATRAAASFQLGKVDAAMADATRAIELKPDFAEAYANRGVFNLSAGKFDRAIADQTRSLELRPSARAYRNRALAYARAGRDEDAVRDLDRAIAMNGAYVEAYRDRAKSLLRTRQEARARADVQRMAELGAAPDPELQSLLTSPRRGS